MRADSESERTAIRVPTCAWDFHNRQATRMASPSNVDTEPACPEAVRDMFEKHSHSRGEPPAPDIEPTAEQLGAVKQLVDSGAPPYVDFALFGPHGRSLLKKLTYTESCYNPSTGDWTKLELPGPADIAGWMRSWFVLECTLLLLELVKPERLRNYLDRITHTSARSTARSVGQSSIRPTAGCGASTSNGSGGSSSRTMPTT